LNNPGGANYPSGFKDIPAFPAEKKNPPMGEED
jgi:hypothetical protein